ncbi:hypothetical protein ACH5RR_012846 [Cinchona calisaya]|uniref:Uncharacterized protein n=1 Tax=Cinchona calisaya TaxID=153742 RepID=A0ABD3ACB8_9GENT
MLKETVILYPAPAIGHLVSMVELGKLVLLHNPNFFVTVLVPSMPSQHDTFSSYTKLISETNNTLITFYPLPSLTLPDDPDHQNPVALACEFMRLNVPNVISALETISISSSSSILALITSAIVTDASYHPKIPTYHYYTSCASSLAFMLHFPTLDSQISPQSFRDLGSSIVQIPGLQPIIKACHVPEPLLDRNQGYDEFLNFATYLPKADGLILNTFNCLETRAIEAISLTIPTLYCVGPIVADAKDRSSVSKNASLDCLSWLDKQPSRSVVFLCFGSRGTFCETQIKQIAIGLERSNQRFLWVVKSPLGSNQRSLR